MTPETLLLGELDSAAAEHFYPWSLLHPVWELRCGPFRLIEWWQRLLSPRTIGCVAPPERQLHRSAFCARFPEQCTGELRLPLVLLDARILPRQSTAERLCELAHTAQRQGVDAVAVWSDSSLAALWVLRPVVQLELLGTGTWTPELAQWAAQLPRETLSLPKLNFLWETLRVGTELFEHAARYFPLGCDARRWRRHGVWVLEPQQVWIADSATLLPGVVLDARTGPILIGEGVTVEPHALVCGPCAIGAGSIVRAHATIGPYSVLGEQCRIGGEITHTIFHAYANKQHEGFVGHSYIGEWVNLGAGTTTSNLKNTYGTVRVELPSGIVDTGELFLGALCGDHAKTAIGTLLRTGIVIGAFANILAGGMEARHVRPFSWGNAAQPQVYELERALLVARRMMARRQRSLLAEEEALIRAVYQQVCPSNR